MYENKTLYIYIYIFFFCYISEKTGHFNTRFYIFIVQKYQPILTKMVEKYARKSQIFWKDFENFMKFPLLLFFNIYIYICIYIYNIIYYNNGLGLGPTQLYGLSLT
jgi:hypothetical protein